MKGPYDDIIDLPHHVSATRARMPVADRAAQFAPFAALTGFGGVIDETARLTESRIELGEGAVEELERALNALAARQDERPEITVTYFRPDELKAGGAYLTVTGSLRRIDGHSRTLILTDGTRIPIADLLKIKSD